jgi:CubicO group peptidase (beta-lactamase class C family)
MPGEGGRRIDAGSLADMLGRHAPRHRVPGAAVGLLRDGVTEIGCYGVADVRTQRPVTPSTPFSLGSLTKPVVASVLARLAAAGDLSFDDSVAARLPETSGAAWAHESTLRDLLANRSGVPLSLDLEFGFDARTDEDDGALARFAVEIADHEPSPKTWSYSNAGWCLLGRAIEVAVGTTFEDAARQHLLSAGVAGISFAVDGPATDRASGHELSENGPVAVPPRSSRAYAAAGTSATGSAETLLELARWHLTEPGLAVLRETTAQLSLPGWFDGWGLGWGRFDWSGGPAWGWDGMIDGERSCVRLLPERQAAVVLLTNASSGRALARTLLPELVDAAFGVAIPQRTLDPTPTGRGDLTRFVGVYAWPDRSIEVTAAAQGLRLTEGDREVLAPPVDDRTFLVDADDPDGPTITFGDFGNNGRPGVLYDMIWGLPRERAP